MTDTNISTSSVVSSLVFNLVLFGIFITCFLALRLKFRRIYSPKSSFDLVPEEKKPVPLPKDPFRWIYILLTKPDSFIIQQAGLDGYFFLRYIYIFGFVFLFGCLTYVILLPVNATNGNGKAGFDMLSISNVKHEKRYYAHALISWVFYGTVTFVIYRELFFFNSLRAAALASPKYAKMLSSRTVLFQNVPRSLLDEKQFFKLFNGVKRIYVTRTFRELEGKINRRLNLAMKLEVAENKLLKAAVKAKLKADKKNITIEPSNDINAYVAEKKRPRMRVGGLFSKKVDTITYCKEEIPKLTKDIRSLRKRYRKTRPKNSIFVEFENQYMAQLAYQSVTHHNPLRMSSRYIGFAPSDIHWANLRIFWWEKIVRRFLAIAFIIALIIFWAVPVAFVGVISNITYLTNKLPWLDWILNLPSSLLGIITSILPTVMLLVLTTFLPIFIRGAARIAGSPSSQEVESFTQKGYFGYMIINVFLITALASSASSTVVGIIEKPQSALSILASHLPTSSNFYISYLILQGLTVSSAALVQVVTFFLHYILSFILDKTLRKKWNRFSGLGSMSWGTTFPVFTNLVCITLAFSIISPLILIFAAIAFSLIYIAYAHNLTYIYVESPDARGHYYPTALLQTFTGIYLGQICLLGIFAVGKGWGPIILQAIGLGSTIFFHFHISEAFNHLVKVVPIDCMKPLDGVSKTASFQGSSEYKTKVLDKKSPYSKKEIAADEMEEEKVKDDLSKENNENHSQIVPLIADRDFKTTDSKNPFIRFMRPDVYLNFRYAKQMLPATYNIEPEEVDNRHAYNLPALSDELPTLWIPRDPMGLSAIEVENLSSSVKISDENSSFSKKGKIIYLGPAP